jgi:hypothetical protein
MYVEDTKHAGFTLRLGDHYVPFEASEFLDVCLITF